MFKKSIAAATALGSTAMVAAGSAFAGGGSSFDTGTITSTFAEYVGYGVIILGAYYGGKWALRAMGLLKPA